MAISSRLSAVLASTALLLCVGCASNGSDQSGGLESSAQSGSQSGEVKDAGPTVIRDSSVDVPKVTFSEEGQPTITVLDTSPPQDIAVEEITHGDGAEIEPDDIVTVKYAGFLWDRSVPFESTFGTEETNSFYLNEVLEGWKWGLASVTVGSTVTIVVPPEYGYGSQGTQGVPADATLVFVIEVSASTPVDAAILQEATEISAELPAGVTVGGDPGEEPYVEFSPTAKPPRSTVIIPLTEGTGPVVTDADSVLYHATMAPWGSSGSQQSTWGRQLQQLPEATPSLLGQRVGSRVMVIEPAPDEGSTATVYVIDIVAAFTK